MNIDYLSALLREKGIKQVELARAAGFLSSTRLNAIIRGWQRPAPSTVDRIIAGLRALGLSEVDIKPLTARTKRSSAAG